MGHKHTAECDCEAKHGHDHEHHHEHGSEKKERIKIIVSAILFAAALLIEHMMHAKTTALPVYLVAYVLVSFDVLKEAAESIIHGEVFDENFLMAVASIGAIALGDYSEAVAIMLLFAIGEQIEEAAEEKSRKSISDLMDIRPDFANLVVGDEIKKVSPEEVHIGDYIIVKPGEKIPMDGKVAEGESSLDTRAITGESVPRTVRKDDNVISGCINNSGALTIRVTREFSESTVSKILELIENADEVKSTPEKFITKFARVYTPVVCGLALLIAVVPSLITGQWSEWINRAITFLVVSCPCALVISVPLAFVGSIGKASKSGILIKGSNYMEVLDKTETVAFDKTGTLTKGVFKVQKVITYGYEEDEILRLAAFAESFSNHPIAKSIIEAYGEEIDYDKIGSFKEISGHGVFANIENKNILAGNDKLMHEFGIEFTVSDEQGTVVYVAVDDKLAAVIVIADEIKEDAYNALSELKKLGVKEFVMLTGDQQKVADYTGEKLGMSASYGDLLPTDKVDKIRELTKREGREGSLAFVGDGINDAPVLAMADVGVAMGMLGSDATIEAADVVLMTDEPSKLAEAIRVSRKALRTAKQNIVFALFVKLLVLVLGAFGLASPGMAVFADVGVMLLCVLNSVRTMK